MPDVSVSLYEQRRGFFVSLANVAECGVRDKDIVCDDESEDGFRNKNDR